jgi:outer membrane biosynthesis protein TonB
VLCTVWRTIGKETEEAMSERSQRFIEVMLAFRQARLDRQNNVSDSPANQAETLDAGAVEPQPDQLLPHNQPMPIEIVAIKRPPQPTAQPATAEPTAKKSGSQRDENLKGKPDLSLPTIETAASASTTNAPKAKKQVKSAQSKPASKSSQNTTTSQPQYQSLAVFTGRLSPIDGHLFFCCADGAILPVAGVHSKLALWLLAHPEAMQFEEDQEWLVYPKAAYKTNDLIVTLRGKLQPERFEVDLEPDTAIVKGRLLEVHDGWFVVGIRRNISPQTYSELAKKKMLTDEFQQFRVCIDGVAPSEVGQNIEVRCQRQGERLLVR